ncbi:MAG: hypothetical protein KDH09_08395, partial [Chrysiogenetes bacterium]|nr:hypothetical protein [Chrysiogenetes bacterium]
MTGQASNSIFLRVNPNSGGEISTLIYPYTNGDSQFAGTSDHFGGSNDSGYGADFDDCAGTKTAVRWDPAGAAEQQWGSGWNDDGSCNLGGNQTGADGNYTQDSQTTYGPQMTPGTESTYESVVVTEMRAAPGDNSREITITQKVIIRDNNQWFAVVYYLNNSSNNNFTDNISGFPEGISFMQDAGFRLQGSSPNG